MKTLKLDLNELNEQELEYYMVLLKKNQTEIKEKKDVKKQTKNRNDIPKFNTEPEPEIQEPPRYTPPFE